MPVNYIKLLNECGFKINNTRSDIIYFQALRKTVSSFGKRFGESLLSHISLELKTPESDFLEYTDLVKKELIDIFGEKATDTILAEVKESVEDIIGSYSNKEISQILKEIKEEDVLRFIADLKVQENTLLLWQSEELKNRIFHEFFNNKKSPMVFFSNSNTQMSRVHTITYEQILKDRKSAIKRENKVISQACQFGVLPVFIGAEDMSEWFKAGLSDDYLKYRTSKKYDLEKSICRLCGFDMNYDIDENTIKKIIIPFNSVIIEHPISIYKLNYETK